MYHLSIFSCSFRSYKYLKVNILAYLTDIYAKSVSDRAKLILHSYLSFLRRPIQLWSHDGNKSSTKFETTWYHLWNHCWIGLKKLAKCQSNSLIGGSVL